MKLSLLVMALVLSGCKGSFVNPVEKIPDFRYLNAGKIVTLRIYVCDSYTKGTGKGNCTEISKSYLDDLNRDIKALKHEVM